MADTLTVRMYNVHFGDAILVTVPDRDPSTHKTTTRRILIDVGNVALAQSPEGGDDAVFKPVVDDVLNQLGGQPLDLYVMTHEHLDHVQGLPHTAWKLYPNDFAQRFKADWVWLTASSAPGYYDTHPDAKKKMQAFRAMYNRLRASLALHVLPNHAQLLEMLANNNPTKTAECVDFLRGLNPARTKYIYRGVSLNGKHPFREAKFEIWAPEEDTSEYYGRFQPLALEDSPVTGAGVKTETAARTGTEAAKEPATPARPLVQATPPAGVDVGAFLNLVEARRDGIADNLLAIDQAANNTSVVFLLEWRGWRLLFSGDAEVRSWNTMAKHGVLKPVHFLKVAHHGSHNGTPDGDVFDTILPAAEPVDRNRVAAISTWTDTYPGIPHAATDQRIESRCELFTTLQEKDELYYDLEFPG
jgi:hypothetical protein